MPIDCFTNLSVVQDVCSMIPVALKVTQSYGVDFSFTLNVVIAFWLLNGVLGFLVFLKCFQSCAIQYSHLLAKVDTPRYA